MNSSNGVFCNECLKAACGMKCQLCSSDHDGAAKKHLLVAVRIRLFPLKPCGFFQANLLSLVGLLNRRLSHRNLAITATLMGDTVSNFFNAVHHILPKPTPPNPTNTIKTTTKIQFGLFEENTTSKCLIACMRTQVSTCHN